MFPCRSETGHVNSFQALRWWTALFPGCPSCQTLAMLPAQEQAGQQLWEVRNRLCAIVPVLCPSTAPVHMWSQLSFEHLIRSCNE